MQERVHEDPYGCAGVQGEPFSGVAQPMEAADAGGSAEIKKDARRLAALEAVLFVAGAPLSTEEAARILRVHPASVKGLMERLRTELKRPERGLMLEEVGGGWRLATKPDFQAYIDEVGRETQQPPLTSAALETLAVIAYRQPVTKAEIDAVRGVRSESALNSLIERGLIEERGRKETPGRPILYGTTDRFLVYFGLKDLSDLPEIPPEPPGDPQSRLPLEEKGAGASSEAQQRRESRPGEGED